MENPLYEFFERTGCAMCPFMSDRAYYVLYKKFPEEWQYMKKLEQKLLAMTNVMNPKWDDKYTMEDREIIFRSKDYKYTVEAPKSCECKMEAPDNQIKIF